MSHDTYLHRVLKSTLDSFDDRSCYESINKSKPWN